MELRTENRSLRWAGVCFIGGGSLMIVLWIIYTTVHGPTSYDRTEVVLGRSTLFWGSLLGSLPNLLIALGLLLPPARWLKNGRRVARAGYYLTLFGLVVPAGLDLFIWGGLGPPFFVPLVGLGLVLTAIGNRGKSDIPQGSLSLLLSMGVLLLASFATALIPQGLSDQVSGYRLYGVLAHFAFGLGWLTLGVQMLLFRRAGTRPSFEMTE